MPRKGFIAKREILPDPIYNNIVVTKLINNIMLDGKKGVAQKIVYDAFNIVQEKKLNHYVEVIEIEDGPLKEACGGIVRDFFRELRAAKKNTKEEESEETK